jgi:S-adenosyl methyltransferase
LASRSDGAIDYIDADLRHQQTIVEHVARTLDFSRPVAVMLIAILHLIGDQDDPYLIVSRLMAGVPSGSTVTGGLRH